MATLKRESIWIHRGVFALCGLAAIILPMVHVTAQSSIWPSPDWLSLLVLAYICRRPRFAPLGLIVMVFFLKDILHMQPIGLWSFLMIILTEFIRANRSTFQEYNFWVEWMFVLLFLSAATLIQHTVLILALAQPPSLIQSAFAVLVSFAFYPLIVFGVTYVLRVRKPAIGEVNAVGQTL